MKFIILILILIFLSIIINLSFLIFLWIYIRNKCQKCKLVKLTRIPGSNKPPQNQDQKLKKFVLQLAKENLRK